MEIADKSQRTYARLAGVLYLAEIAVALGASFVLTRISGSGTFAETAKRITASEHLYRAALSAIVIVSLGSTLLAFALYATLKPVNRLLAQLAMIFMLEDSFLALVVRMCSFVRLQLQLGSEAVTAQAFVNLLRNIANVTENLGGICFGIGSLIFFYLFFKSAFIPRALSALGLAASALWIGLYFSSLIFPEYRSIFQYTCFLPMIAADVITGFYLMLFAVKTEFSSTSV